MELSSTFDDMKLNDKLLRGIYGNGLEKPSSIQQRAIPQLLTKRDLIAQSQSGTGKTATFSIGILELLDLEVNNCQALVLEPTRELAIQTENVTGFRLLTCQANQVEANFYHGWDHRHTCTHPFCC